MPLYSTIQRHVSEQKISFHLWISSKHPRLSRLPTEMLRQRTSHMPVMSRPNLPAFKRANKNLRKVSIINIFVMPLSLPPCYFFRSHYPIHTQKKYELESNKGKLTRLQSSRQMNKKKHIFKRFSVITIIKVIFSAFKTLVSIPHNALSRTWQPVD